MAAQTVKEEFVGDPPLCHSVEMLQLDGGSFEVVLRMLPDRDPDSLVYSDPKREIRTFTNRAEAELFYKTALQLITRVGPPG
ncbi:hypothetical protein [Methylocella sp.]|jgi:hypothetical protein|uniref:hypothetical protein n=1 Tax=Methylocella sp. TaxID=1978226 RepID=UPI003C2083C4